MDRYPPISEHGSIGDLQTIGLTGEQLGNFPQAFTHRSLIDAAIDLNSQLARRSGWGRHDSRWHRL